MALNRIAARVEEIDTITTIVEYLLHTLGGVLSPVGKNRFQVTKVSRLGWAARTRQLEGHNVTRYPFIGLSLHDLSESPDFRWNQQALHNGFYRREEGTGILWHYKLDYVRLNFGLLIRTDSEEQVRGILQRFRFNQREIQGNINLQGLRLPVKVQFDSGLTSPEMEDSEAGNVQTLQSGITVYFFVGKREAMPEPDKAKIGLFLKQSKENGQDDSILLDTFSSQRQKDGKYKIHPENQKNT